MKIGIFSKMGILVYGIVLLGGAYLALKLGDIYWALAWVGICIAYGIVARKLNWREAFKLIFFTILSVVIMLGGAVILARTWGEAFGFFWIILCIILIIIFGKRIVRFFPTLEIAQKFQKIVVEAEQKERKDLSREESNEED